MKDFRKFFLLDRNVVYLNHGSFGACPKPVFAEYQRWQQKLELQPVDFFTTVLPREMAAVRRTLAGFIKAPAQCVALIPNATFGVNALARSLALQPGDEILTTDHEYGACDKVWQFTIQKTGARYVRVAIPAPFESPDSCVERIWRGVTPRTRVIFMSHITSPTACIFPVGQICARARKARIITIIDGAHCPGQIPLDLGRLGPDFYTGNAHKWLCTPKGSAFLYARRDAQHLVEPLIISWGWGEERQFSVRNDFLDYFYWTGTNDYAAYLSIPAAIRFQQEHDWPQVTAQCHRLLGRALAAIEDLTGFPSMYSSDSLYRQMAIVRIPAYKNSALLKKKLIGDYRIEIPVIAWNNQLFLRLSVQCYTTDSDIEKLTDAIRSIFRL